MPWFLFCPRVSMPLLSSYVSPGYRCWSIFDPCVTSLTSSGSSGLLLFPVACHFSFSLFIDFLDLVYGYIQLQKKKIALTSPTVMLCHFSLYLHFWILPNPQHSQNQLYSQQPTLKCHVWFYTAQPLLETRVVQDRQWLCLRPHSPWCF